MEREVKARRRDVEKTVRQNRSKAETQIKKALGDVETEADVVLDAAMALDWIEQWRQARTLVDEAKALV